MATVYWFGGSGNWSDQANHWSNNSGNSPASLHGSVPGTNDDVVFDTASSAAEAAYTVTIDAEANCQNFTMDGPSTTDATQVTWAGTMYAMNIYGSFNLSGGTAGINRTIGGNSPKLNFLGTSGTKTINFNGVTWSAPVVFNGAATFQMASNFFSTGVSSAGSWTLTSGTFDPSTYTVTFDHPAGTLITGAFTFYNLTISGDSVTTNVFNLASNITVSNTLNINGDSALNRILVKSNTAGTQRTITAASFVVDNVGFQDIVCAGAGAPCAPTTSATDFGNNSGITFNYNRYWVGGAGGWFSGTHWSTTSGGTGNQCVPYIYDNVVFDSSSNASAYAVSFTTSSLFYCNNVTFGNPASGALTLSGSNSGGLSVYGNFSVAASVVFSFDNTVQFCAVSGTKTVTTNSVPLSCSIRIFATTGATIQLVDDLNFRGQRFTMTSGTFDPNGKTVTMGSNAPDIIPDIAVSFYNLTFQIYYSALSDIRLYGNITVTNTLTIAGNSAIKRAFIKSSVLGTARTITAAAISVSNADFQDITGAGAATWDMSAATGGSGNCGGNTMKALGDAAFTTADTWYWHADTGNVSDYTKWYTDTNGGGTQMASTLVPLPQDTLRFDASSFDSGSKTVTQNMPRIGSVDFTGATNTPTFTTSTAASVFGSITLISGMILTSSTQTYTFEGRSSYTLDSGGKTWGKAININNYNGTTTLKSDFITTGNLILQSGTFSALDGATSYNVSFSQFYAVYTTNRYLIMGDGLWTCLYPSGTAWSVTAAGFNVTPGNSTIKLAGTLTDNITFGGASKIYNNIWNATTGNYVVIISDSNTFNDFKIDAGREVNFTNTSNTTVNTFTALGTSGSHIVIHNTSATTHATLTKTGGGVITGCDYIDIQEMTGSPASTWYIGPNSTDTGSTCTNIYLNNAPTFSPGFLLTMLT